MWILNRIKNLFATLLFFIILVIIMWVGFIKFALSIFKKGHKFDVGVLQTATEKVDRAWEYLK